MARFSVTLELICIRIHSASMSSTKRKPKIKVRKPLSHQAQIDPQYRQKTWTLLRTSIGHIHQQNSSGLSFEELYRCVAARPSAFSLQNSALTTRAATRTQWCCTSTATFSTTASSKRCASISRAWPRYVDVGPCCAPLWRSPRALPLPRLAPRAPISLAFLAFLVSVASAFFAAIGAHAHRHSG